jgi:hypothetical protein
MPNPQRHQQRCRRNSFYHMIIETAKEIERVAVEDVFGLTENTSRRKKKKRFKAWFGMNIFHCSILWHKLQDTPWFHQNSPTSRGVKYHHLLMGLSLMKSYHTEEVNAVNFKCDDKTFRLWSWFIVKSIAKLDRKVVSICIL